MPIRFRRRRAISLAGIIKRQPLLCRLGNFRLFCRDREFTSFRCGFNRIFKTVNICIRRVKRSPKPRLAISGQGAGLLGEFYSFRAAAHCFLRTGRQNPGQIV